MRTLKNLCLCFMVVSAVIFTSCKSDDDGGDGGNASRGTIEAKVNGTSFKSLEMTSIASYVSANKVLTIQGNDSDGKTIIIVINGYEGVGSYDIGGPNTIFVVASYNEINVNNPANTQIWQAPYEDAVAGVVSISEDSDDNVKGTFDFEGKNAADDSFRTISDGSFNLDKQIF